MSATSPLRPLEVAARAGRGTKGIYRHLANLVKLGLAKKVGNGYVRIEEAAAHRDAAQMRGTWGRSERRSVKLKLETNSWRSRLEEWRVAREQKKRRNDFKGELQSRTAEQEPEKQSAVCPELESYSAQSNIRHQLRE